MLSRYKEIVDYMSNLPNLNLLEDEAIFEFEKELKDKIDYLLGTDASETIFKAAGPLTPLESGEMYFENALNAIGTAIEHEMGIRVEKMQKKIDEYIKYEEKNDETDK